MATQINAICEAEERNRLPAKSRDPQLLMPTGEEEREDNPFHIFSEWDSEADSIYDTLR
ncbi:MAG: hypothetical protein WC091_19420 [Sulfuricellaceae bacterium]